jgi:formate hydrogenlyase subunit 4
LRVMTAAASGSATWLTPMHWCALAGFALVVVAETGRQPIDNPDTHLELIMIHEGPLLEYAGPDLAYLQWSAAARHWIVLVLATDLFLPHPNDFWLGLATLGGWLVLGCLGLALTETILAKARLLRLPALLGAATAVAGLGLVTRLVGIP